MLRKYSVTFVLLAFIVVGIVMYATTGWKNNDRPNFRIITVEGDASAGNSIKINRSYRYTGSGNASTAITISQQNEPLFTDDRVHFQWFSGNGIKDRLGDTKQKRNFLADKKLYGRFVDEQTLLSYINTESVDRKWQTEVAVLNKKTGETYELNLSLSQDEDTSSWSSRDVHAVDDSNIIVFLERNYNTQQKSGISNSDMIRFDINLDELTVTKKTDLTSALPGHDNVTHQATVTSMNDTYMLVQDEIYSESINDAQADAENSDQSAIERNKVIHYYAYDIVNDKMLPLGIDDNGMKINSYMHNFVDNRLDHVTASEGVIYYSAYDLSGNGEALPGSWTVDTHAWGANTAYVVDHDDRTIQILYGNKSSSKPIYGIALVDIATGNVIYRGEVKTDGTEDEQAAKLRHLDIM